MDGSGLEHLLPQDAQLIAEIRRRRQEASAHASASRPAPRPLDRKRIAVAGLLYAATAALGLLMILHGLPRTVLQAPVITAADGSSWPAAALQRGPLPLWIAFGCVLLAAGGSAIGILAKELVQRRRG